MKRLCTASVMDKLDVRSKTTIRKYVKSGFLPRPMQDPGGNYWLESEIDQVLKRQAEQRDNREHQAAA